MRFLFLGGGAMGGAFAGAAALEQSSTLHPSALRDSVCTPGGTTIKGLRRMNELGLVEAMAQVLDQTMDANS